MKRFRINQLKNNDLIMLEASGKMTFCVEINGVEYSMTPINADTVKNIAVNALYQNVARDCDAPYAPTFITLYNDHYYSLTADPNGFYCSCSLKLFKGKEDSKEPDSRSTFEVYMDLFEERSFPKNARFMSLQARLAKSMVLDYLFGVSRNVINDFSYYYCGSDNDIAVIGGAVISRKEGCSRYEFNQLCSNIMSFDNALLVEICKFIGGIKISKVLRGVSSFHIRYRNLYKKSLEDIAQKAQQRLEKLNDLCCVLTFCKEDLN